MVLWFPWWWTLGYARLCLACLSFKFHLTKGRWPKACIATLVMWLLLLDRGLHCLECYLYEGVDLLTLA